MKIPPLESTSAPIQSKAAKQPPVEKEPVSANGMIRRSGPVRGDGAPSDADIRKKVWERRAGIESPGLGVAKKTEDRPQPFPLDTEEGAMKVANDLVETNKLNKNDPNVLNNPDSPGSNSKIKDLMNRGGFNFNEKEKTAIGSLLKTP
jgi:hypothetical protein